MGTSQSVGSVVVLGLLAGCGDLMDHDHGGMDHGMSGDRNPPCEVEEDCEVLGPGNMCMGGMCMVMDVVGPAVAQPSPGHPFANPPVLRDLDPSDEVFEANLTVTTARVELVDGAATQVFAYADGSGEGSIPGPTVDVAEGTTVRIHVTNRLDEATTIHWHGLVLPVEMDGVPDMPVPAIEPGATYTYEFVARHPALYWYHPHVRSDVQVERGLYGAFIVRPSVAVAEVAAERVVVLDDILLDETGQIEAPSTGSDHLSDPDTGEITMTFEGMMGRQGNHLLVNGALNPVIEVRAGSIERWRVVNVANARFFDVAMPDATLVRIGGDGGLSADPREIDSVLLGSAQRADLLIRFDGDPGDEYSLVTTHYDRGHDMADPGPLELARVRLVGEPTANTADFPELPDVTIEELAEGPVVHTIVMSETIVRGGRMGFELNGALWPDTPVESGTLGAVETWELVNQTHMAHPFHIHGTRFQVSSESAGLDSAWVAVDPREWTDTVIVPGESRIRIVVRFEDFAGSWMFHCHILEHAERGMMGMIEVEDPHAAAEDSGANH